MSRTREQLKREHNIKISIIIIIALITTEVICSVISIYRIDHYYDLYTYLPEGYEIVYESHEIQPQETVESIVGEYEKKYKMKVPLKVMLHEINKANNALDINNIHAGNYILVPVFKQVK